MSVENVLRQHQCFKETTRLRKNAGISWLVAGSLAKLSGLRLLACYRFFRPALPDSLDGGGNVVISLTSFPKRIGTIWMVIDALMRQTKRPAEIILCLYKGDFPDLELPESLTPYLERGLRIIWAEENLRSHLKYYYAFKEELSGKRRCVITVDDDLFYAPDMVDRLLELHEKHPDSVCANICRRVSGPHYSDWIQVTEESAPDKSLLAIGSGGALYPPSVYERERFYDMSAIRSFAMKADDLWLLKCENLEGIGVAAGKFFAVPPAIPSSQGITLSSSNVGQGVNDEIWAKLKEYR